MNTMTRQRCRWVAVASLLCTMAAASAQESSPATPPLPDSPGTVWSQTSPAATQRFNDQRPPEPEIEPRNQAREPVGTAVAGAPVTTGVVASAPAGAAIAPAKQRRVRILLIKMSAVVGAGAAIGAVTALSTGSPSRPPGSR